MYTYMHIYIHIYIYISYIHIHIYIHTNTNRQSLSLVLPAYLLTSFPHRVDFSSIPPLPADCALAQFPGLHPTSLPSHSYLL